MNESTQMIQTVALVLVGFATAGVGLWLLVKLSIWLGLYRPTGPVDRRLARLFVVAVVFLVGLGMVLLVGFWLFSGLFSARPLNW